ncbi:MAG: hypothetical protein ABI220_00160 [Candidatus Saccharimonadales bacterium]
MVKQKPKKPSGNTNKLYTSKKKYIIYGVIVVVAFLAAAFFIRTYQHDRLVDKQFAADKIRFAQTENDMADAYAAIVKSAGQPYETSVTRGCAYGALKFARGPLGCMINYGFAYSVNNSSEGKINGQLVHGIIDGHFGFSKGSTMYGIAELAQQAGEYGDFLDSIHGLGCTLDHNTYAPDDYNSFGRVSSGLHKDTTTYMSTFYFLCEKNTPRAIYEIQKSAY